MYVLIGNADALEGYRDPTSEDPEQVLYRQLPGDRVTEIKIADFEANGEPVKLLDAAKDVVESMRHHLAPGATPAWIESDNAALQLVLREHYGSRSERPQSWGEETGAQGAINAVLGLAEGGAVMAFLSTMFTLMVLIPALLTRLMFQLRTNAGRDWQSRVMGDTSSTGSGAYGAGIYIGVTADATAASAASTLLTSEITTGTLVRAVATYAHTNGQATYTLTKTFTSDQTVVLAKAGVFNGAGPGGAATTSNTLIFETLLNATASLVSGDQTQITVTVTL